MNRPRFTEEQIDWIDKKFVETKTILKGKMKYQDYLQVLSALNEFYAAFLLDHSTID